MKVCVVGSGGREHALARTLARSASEVVVTPGNAGIPGSTPAPPEEIEADLFVIGPEQPLAEGMADRLRGRGRLVFGPGADGARLESSKAWMKALLDSARIPTARHGVFDAVEPAVAFLDGLGGPYVVKTDGLAAGKGVLVTDDRAEAVADVESKLSGRGFGEAGLTVVIEEGLSGAEVSLMAVCDGSRLAVLPASQDHKRLGDGDAGPNTGGMGAYSPVPFLAPALVSEVTETCIEPTLAALAAQGIDYRGVLYAGLMLTPDGPRVLEFNARFGDPETQVVLPRLDGDVASFLAAAAGGELGAAPEPAAAAGACVTVVMASEGYPASPRVGDRILGIEAAEALPGVSVFCAGVASGPGGSLVTGGGRVLNVTAVGDSVAEASARAYAGVDRISFTGAQYRTDIGAQAVAAGR
ncbi:MAG TPA: phosphoribosylamine--glycine ligase [Acidimicrobiales bacterium]|nr:phosphoribosylamine--glycine ligase [Acidimicrobiales bacterium]